MHANQCDVTIIKKTYFAVNRIYDLFLCCKSLITFDEVKISFMRNNRISFSNSINFMATLVVLVMLSNLFS